MKPTTPIRRNVEMTHIEMTHNENKQYINFIFDAKHRKFERNEDINSYVDKY